MCERPRHRCEDDIQMDVLSETVGGTGLDSSGWGYEQVAGGSTNTRGFFGIAEELLASQQGFCSADLGASETDTNDRSGVEWSVYNSVLFICNKEAFKYSQTQLVLCLRVFESFWCCLMSQIKTFWENAYNQFWSSPFLPFSVGLAVLSLRTGWLETYLNVRGIIH